MNAVNATITILDLACGGGGASSVERALRNAPGVISAYVNPATERAYVTFDPGRTSLAELGQAIRATGHVSLSEAGGQAARADERRKETRGR